MGNAKRPASVRTVENLESRLLMAVQPVISEFLAENKNGITDEDGAHSDWLEIHNPNPSVLDLSGYYFTDSNSDLTQWQIPAGVSIAASGDLLIWASGNDRKNPANPLHTNFSLSKAGEYLALVEPDGSTIAFEYAPAFPVQSQDVSYGIVGDKFTNPSFGFFSNPTPGAPNMTTSVGQVADPAFSAQRGFYESSFQLAISSPTPGATIRYTTDGSTPSSTAGTVYSGPISISTTTNVRAIAYRGGVQPSTVITQTYIFLDDVINQPKSTPGFPNTAREVEGGVDVPLDTQMDPNVVDNPAYAGAIKGALQSIPTLSLTAPLSSFFGSNGVYDAPENSDLEQPVSIELIDPAHPEDNSGVNGGAEGHSNAALKRSLRISFKSDYGPTKWNTDLLKNAPLNGDTASDELDSLVLRGGKNRSWAYTTGASSYVEDEWYRATQVAINGGKASHGTFVHLYINGVYWGLYDVAERPDENWQSEYYGGDQDDYFSVNHGKRESGDSSRFDYLTNTLINKDLSKASNYDELKQYLDVGEYADYLLLNWFQGTTDWPNNNWYGGYDASGNKPFKYFAWDGEYSWDRENDVDADVNGAFIPPAFYSNTNDVESASINVHIFKALQKNSDFMQLLADRAAALTAPGAPLSNEAVLARYDTLTSYISSAIIGESARWGDTFESVNGKTLTKVDWQNEVNRIRSLMANNDDRFIDVLRDQDFVASLDAPKIGSPGSGSVSISNPNGSGKIYYTTDGSDPRASGGGISSMAKLYSGAVALTGATTKLNARVLSGDSWSTPAAGTFTAADYSPLRIVELMYNPAPPAAPDTTDGDEFEFIEIENTGATSLNLKGVRLDGGVTFTFDDDLDLAPGAYAVLAEDPDAFATRYPGVAVAGKYSGKLSDDGEEIQLLDPTGAKILDFTYSPEWYAETNGNGASLVIVDPTAAPSTWNDASNWRASSIINGTPGAANGTSAGSNQAPTVVVSGPDAVNFPAAATLSATVTDDGLPAGNAVSISWTQVSGPGSTTFSDPSAASTTATFSLAGAYVLRATASDGELSSSNEITIVAAGVATPLPTVTATDDSVGRNIAQPLDIDVAANDSNPDAAALFLSILTPPAGGTAAVNDHGTPADLTDDTITYTPTPGFNGDDAFVYQVSNGVGSSGIVPSSATVHISVNPGAALDVDPNDSTKTALFIVGTDASETFKIARQKTLIKVLINKAQRALLSPPTGSVVIIAKGGNDKLSVGALKNSPAIFYGGEGNDNLKGTKFNDLLIGGGGDDTINGAAGADILIGGNGLDKISGAAGDDVLISGSSDYDAYSPGNVAASRDLLAAWTSAQPYASRVASLTSDAGVGSSAAHFVQTLLHDDSSIDKVNGAAGDDLYLVNSGLEKIKKTATETVIALP